MYRPKNRVMTPLLARQISEQELRIKEAGKQAKYSYTQWFGMPERTFYSNRFKDGTRI